MNSYAVAEQQTDLIRQRARETVARTFAANRGLTGLDMSLVLGTASVAFSSAKEKRIWLEEIQQYEQEHGL